MTTNSNRPQSDEVLQGKSIEGPLGAPGTLDGIIHVFGCWIGPLWIVTSSSSILLVENGLVLFKALHLGVVKVLGEGNESRRRRIGGRHFVWRMGQWCRRQWLTLLLSA